MTSIWLNCAIHKEIICKSHKLSPEGLKYRQSVAPNYCFKTQLTEAYLTTTPEKSKLESFATTVSG